MCGAPASSTIDAVADRQTLVIRLELHVDDDSPTGRASDGTGAAREFVGWMGLVAAIDALIRGNPPVPTAPGSISPEHGGTA